MGLQMFLLFCWGLGHFWYISVFISIGYDIIILIEYMIYNPPPP